MLRLTAAVVSCIAQADYLGAVPERIYEDLPAFVDLRLFRDRMLFATWEPPHFTVRVP